MKKRELLLVKLGGSLITDKRQRYSLREEVLERLSREIGGGWKKRGGELDLVIGNGAGSFAHFSARKYGTKDGFKDKMGAVGAGWVRWDAVKLNQIIVESLLKQEVPVFSFAPSSLMVIEKDEVKKIELRGLRIALEKGLVPSVYGDVMVDGMKGSTIFSTEKVFEGLLIGGLGRDYGKVRVIHVGEEEGVRGKEGIIEEISERSWNEVKEFLGGSGGVDVTGGMWHKVRMSLELSKMGVESLIINGLIEGRLEKAILGKGVKGTRIVSDWRWATSDKNERRK